MTELISIIASRAVCLVMALQAVPAGAQEVATIVSLKDWRASGVCVGIDQCGFCTASSQQPPGVILRITPPAGVAVFFANGQARTAMSVEIGSQTFNLAWEEGDTYALDESDGATVVRAMQHEETLTVRTGSDGASARYRYNLSEFPRVHAAILKACRGIN